MEKMFIVLYPDQDQKNVECLDNGFNYIPMTQVTGEITATDVIQMDLTGFKGEPLRSPGPGDILIDLDKLEVMMIQKVGFRILPNENQFFTLREQPNGEIYLGNLDQMRDSPKIPGDLHKIVEDKIKGKLSLEALLSQINILIKKVDSISEDDSTTEEEKRALLISNITELVELIFANDLEIE